MIPFDEKLAEDEEEEHCFGRLRGKQTKEEAIYGVFLSSDDDSEPKTRSSRRSRGIQQRDRSIQFVTGSVQNSSSSVPYRKKPRRYEQVTASDEELVKRLYTNYGDGEVVGYASSSTSLEESEEENQSDISGDFPQGNRSHYEHHPGLGALLDTRVDDNPVRRELFPRGQNSLYSGSDSDDNLQQQTNLSEDDWRFRFTEMAKKKKREASKGSSASTKKAPLPESRMAKMYGKGYAMLKKMGYSGGGLGREGSGIVNPLQVKVRQKHRGLQESGEKMIDGNFPHHDMAEDGPSAVELLLGTNQSKKRDTETARRQWRKNVPRTHIVYKTSAEIIEESTLKQRGLTERLKVIGTYREHYIRNDDFNADVDVFETLLSKNGTLSAEERDRWHRLRQEGLITTGPTNAATTINVIDMTQPEHNVIKTKAALNAALATHEGVTSPKPKKPLAEIIYNLRTYVTELQRKIEDEARQRVIEEEKLSFFSKKENQAKEEAASARRNAAMLREIFTRVERLRRSPSVRSIERCLVGTDGENANSKTQALRRAACLKYTAFTLDALTSPVIEEAHDSAETDVSSDASKSDPVLLEEILCSIAHEFQCLKAEFPEYYFRFNLPSVAHRLAQAALAYIDKRQQSGESSLSDEDPLYLPSLLVQFRDECFALATTRNEEITTIRNTWQSIINKRVLDGLRATLSTLKVNPANQDIQPLLRVFQWLGPISGDSIAQLLKEEFFPQWNQALCQWLALPTVNLEEVHIWYQGWRSLFPEELAGHKVIQQALVEGLERIEEYLEGLNTSSSPPCSSKPSAQSDISAWSRENSSLDFADSSPVDETSQNNSSRTAAAGDRLYPTAAAATMEQRLASGGIRLADVLEAVAEKHNILMLPKYGRMHHGKQVYAFGPVLIYMEAGVIYAFAPQSGTWDYISPQALLERAIKTVDN